MSVQMEWAAWESARLTSSLTDVSKEVNRLSAEYASMRYLFVRKRAAAPENWGFQKRSISRPVVMRCSKKMSTGRERQSVLCSAYEG